MKKITLFIIACLLLGQFKAMAQDDLLGDLEKEDNAKPKQNITTGTFKSTRVINMQSVEITGKGNLQFMISHHFGNIWENGKGWSNLAEFAGLNGGVANTLLSLDYSPTTWGNVGLALTGKAQYELWGKLKLLRQQTGEHNIPVTLDWFSTMHIDCSEGASPEDFVWNRMSYLHQLLIARKFSDKLSLQLTPSYVHYNYTPYYGPKTAGGKDANNVFSVGIGGRYKFTSKKALTFEYSRQLNGYKNLLSTETGGLVNYNPDLISLGYDWDTGGHIFQFYVSSTTAASNITQLSRNTSDFKQGNFSLGFTINRSFGVKKVVKTAP
ncbi:DUF5777 family beta-barrel protein [Pinibacter soli]|uniref:DUF5777 family beta-barrel protein n=1 Tax=Pinibacter soli TaxID=3044211 RepID=A0ABT6R6U1_9BACT|nr:DUF5777 family beta-barrel protein [Pinibacter soli]MDI3318267.1 DUF5777 family beta-barrel protein [Pinibacter soli]